MWVLWSTDVLLQSVHQSACSTDLLSSCFGRGCAAGVRRNEDDTLAFPENEDDTLAFPEPLRRGCRAITDCHVPLCGLLGTARGSDPRRGLIGRTERPRRQARDQCDSSARGRVENLRAQELYLWSPRTLTELLATSGWSELVLLLCFAKPKAGGLNVAPCLSVSDGSNQRFSQRCAPRPFRRQTQPALNHPR